jgi:hypothetical protein
MTIMRQQYFRISSGAPFVVHMSAMRKHVALLRQSSTIARREGKWQAFGVQQSASMPCPSTSTGPLSLHYDRTSTAKSVL